MHKSNTIKTIFIYIICCFSIANGMSKHVIPESPPGNEKTITHTTTVNIPATLVNKTHKVNNSPKACLLFSSALVIPILLQLILKIDTPNQNIIHLRDCNICPNGEPPKEVQLHYIRHNRNQTRVNYTAECEADNNLIFGDTECEGGICSRISDASRNYGNLILEPTRLPKEYSMPRRITCNSNIFYENKNPYQRDRRWGTR
jgi:hypothetical protein